MIYKFIGSSTSDRFIGTTYSGVTFSTTLGVRVIGLSGSALIHKTQIRNAAGSFVGGQQPVVLAGPPAAQVINYTLPDPANVINGQVFIYRRTDLVAPNGTQFNVLAGDSVVQSIRFVESGTNQSSFSTTLNQFGCFFYAFNRWWQY
jgi:hypothetical protein